MEKNIYFVIKIKTLSYISKTRFFISLALYYCHQYIIRALYY
ncbi:hypothetical protein [Arsenophonus endosymbiont of Bemisia tabaci]|nr:hypothetical protein [Arsenophonus endosymbiont of Bemisia tabaci]